MKKKYQRKHSLVNKTGYTPGYSTEHNPYNIIPGEDITMRNTPYPVHGTPLDENGNPMDSGLVMQPGQEYKFGGASYVAEVPMYKDGGSKQDWISHKIGILINEGYPQKQAVAIAYSMYDQHHANGGYQLPMYQKAGVYNNGNFGGSLTYGQTQNQPSPSTTYDPNKKVDPNALTPEAIAAYEKQQKAQDQGISLSGIGEYDTENNALNNPVLGMSNPELMPSKAQLKSNKQLNTATKNYDENGNAIDTSEEARNKAENSFGGNPLYQFANLEGDMGTDDALFHLGKNIENGSSVGIAASAATALLKGGKDFFAGMGSQRRQNNMMQSYYDKQRDGMTGAGREAALKMGEYYEDGGEDLGFDPNSARDTWVAKTGMPWSEAKRLGYTDGSAKNNIKLLSELNDERFDKSNLRNTPMVSSTPQLSKSKPKSPTWYKEGVYKKAYDESDFKDDIDRNKQPYPADIDMVQTKKPVAKVPAKKTVAKTPQLQKKAPAKVPTQGELDAVWGKSRVSNPLQDFIITDKRQGMSHVIKDGKVVKSFPVLTGQNVEANRNDYNMDYLEKHPEARSTPVGTYLMKPAANIYGKRGFDLKPIAAYGEEAPLAKNTAIHVTYPKEFKQRDPLYKMPAKNRYASYGCTNGRCPDVEDLADRFPVADTAMVIDSKRAKDKALLSKFGIKQEGGYYQEGGMQPGMEEGMEGQMSNPQEESMEQQGGSQEQQIMQEVAQMLQQGADPQQVIQQLVQIGIPQEQAVQMVQSVMQQVQGATPQMKRGGMMYYQDGGEEDGGDDEEKADLINKYPNRSVSYSSDQADYAEVPKQSTTEESKEEQQIANFDPNSARDTWVAKTGMPWSEAKRLGYTDGSAKNNIKLLSELNDPRFNKKYLISKPLSPAKRNVPAPSNPNFFKPVSPAKRNVPAPSNPNFFKPNPKFEEEYRRTHQIRQVDEGDWRDKVRNGAESVVEYLGNPFQTFGHYTKYHELPAKGFSKHSQNAYDMVLDFENPFGWGSHAVNATQQAGQGQYKKAAEEALGAAGALKTLKYTKYIPLYEGLPATGSAARGSKLLGQGTRVANYQDGGEQQIIQQVAQALQEGAKTQQVMQMLLKSGMSQDQAVQLVQAVMQQIQQQGHNAQEEGAEGGQLNPQEEVMEQGTPQMRRGGEMIKRADGSYSRRGMWDNIRDNKGSGKAPTKEMLEQERRIRANKKEMGGYMYANGGTNNPGFNALPDYVQNKILSNMYQEGGEAMDEQREGENEGAEGESANLEQIESQVEQALKQGADPQQILQQLVQMGIPQEQAVQMIQEILQEIQNGETGMEAPEQGAPQMRDGGNYLNTLKGKTIKDYAYNPKTNSYTVSYE